MHMDSPYVRTGKPQACRRFRPGQARLSASLRGAGGVCGNGRSGENAALGHRAHHGSRAGWRSGLDTALWRQGFVAVAAGSVSMALLACAVALARDTTGHDWYAAYKITVAELTIGVGFDGDTPVEYRNEDGAVGSVSRLALTHTFEARWARRDILEAARDGATLGALSGFGGALLCLMLVWRSMEDRRGRRAANGPVSDRRGEALDRAASPPASPASTTAPARPAPATAAPVRPAAAGTPQAAKAQPAAGHDGPGSGKDNRKAPARRERRQRDHGRWV